MSLSFDSKIGEKNEMCDYIVSLCWNLFYLPGKVSFVTSPQPI